MATWEDGPEYAPLERPDEFADPSAGTVGLEPPPAVPAPPPAPIERPAFGDPGQPVPPLASLVPVPPAQRDPQQPFDVATSLVTAESSAWASTHWSAPGSPGQHPATAAPSGLPALSGPPTPTGPATTGWPSTNGQHQAGPPANGQRPSSVTGSIDYPPPEPGTLYGQTAYGPSPYDQPPYGHGSPQPTPSTQTWPGYPPPEAGSGGRPFPPPGPSGAGGPFPAPGTPQWFSPGGHPPAVPPTPSPNARTVLAAVTPGVLVTLVVGGFIAVLAPVTIVVAFLLASRMTYGRRITRTAFAAVLAFLGLVGLLSLVTADGLFSQWWDTVAGWACFGSWVMVVASAIAAYRALQQGRPDPPPTPRR